MHLTCKNTPITPDRSGSKKRPEKKPKRYHRIPSPCPVLDEISWQIATTVQKTKWKSNRHAGSWLSRLPLTINGNGKVQVRAVDQTAYPLQTSIASLATDWCMEPWPPATNQVEVLHLFFKCFTHTPRCRGAFCMSTVHDITYMSMHVCMMYLRTRFRNRVRNIYIHTIQVHIVHASSSSVSPANSRQIQPMCLIASNCCLRFWIDLTLWIWICVSSCRFAHDLCTVLHMHSISNTVNMW